MEFMGSFLPNVFMMDASKWAKNRGDGYAQLGPEANEVAAVTRASVMIVRMDERAGTSPGACVLLP